MREAYTHIGGYPLMYIGKQGDILCYQCAEASHKAMIHWEGESQCCDNCNEETESAYGVE